MTPPDWHRFPLRISLDDLQLALRPITADDKARIVEGLRSISAETSYRRFFTPAFYPTDEQLHYLTDVDGEHHMALGAVNAESDDTSGVGVARYIRLPDAPTVAEAAVLVIDAYHRRGIGSILLMALSRYACEHGIETFRGYVLRENDAFLTYLRTIGATSSFLGEGMVQVDVPVMCTANDLPDTPEAERARWAWRIVDAVWSS